MSDLTVRIPVCSLTSFTRLLPVLSLPAVYGDGLARVGLAGTPTDAPPRDATSPVYAPVNVASRRRDMCPPNGGVHGETDDPVDIPPRQSRPGGRSSSTGHWRPAHRRPIRAAMRRESGAAGRTAGADPARAWVEEWRRLIPPPGVWWRKSAFDLAQGPTHEPPPALAVAHRTGGHVPDLARHGPPLPGGTDPVEPARGGRRRRRPAAVGPRPAPAAGRRVLRRRGDGHRRRRVRQDPDDGGAGGLRRPPPRHAARGGRLHHLHEQGHRGRSGNGRANACRASRWARSTSSRAGC